MLGILYILIACFSGYFILKKFIPSIFSFKKWVSLNGKPVPLGSLMVVLPSSFLVGTLLMTWVTYISSYIFRFKEQPLFYGNIISFTIFSVFLLVVALFNRDKIATSIKSGNYKKKLSQLNISFLKTHIIEICYVLVSLIVWTFFMFRSFYVDVKVDENNVVTKVMKVGHSVFSDFAPHLAVIRSFSFGSNFPTEYPHFADGNIKYHFMFQFLTGNLEFLGMRIDWAFNLPSILSIVSFLMLLYSFTVILLGKKWIGAFTGVLFFFRSSFAIFTFISEKPTVKESLGSITSLFEHIGKTQHEEWGLYAQKVYVNQRHLPFALAVMMLVLIIVIPLFIKMMRSFSNKEPINDPVNPNSITEMNIENNTDKSISNTENYTDTHKKLSSFNIKDFIMGKDSWISHDIYSSIAAGIILGLTGFWNGAVVIATLPILVVLAIFSKQRLSYINIGILGILLPYIQTQFFIGSGENAIKPSLYYGFLSYTGDLAKDLSSYSSNNGIGEALKLVPKLTPYIANFYIELLGILLFLVLAWVLPKPKKYNLISIVLLTVITTFIAFYFIRYQINDTLLVNKNVFMVSTITAFSILIAAYVCLYNFGGFKPPKGSIIAAFALSTPIILATTIKLTPNIDVNHKYVIMGAILLNIFAASFIYSLIKSKNICSCIVAVLLGLILTATGIVDIVTLYNLDKNYVEIKFKDETLLWTKENTGKNEIFLTDNYSLHPILLAGRKIFTGWPYYASSAGYDTDTRERIRASIYGATDEETLKTLVKKHNISYIVIDDGIRLSEQFTLNEELIKRVYKNCFTDTYGALSIYRTY